MKRYIMQFSGNTFREHRKIQGKEKKNIGKLLGDCDGVTRALARAVRQALLQQKRIGNPVATWHDGKLVWIAPEEIEVSEEIQEDKLFD